MKTLITSLALLATTLSVSAKTFEGYIHYTMKSGKHAFDMSYALKGDQMRMDMDTKGGESIGLFDGKSGEMHILMPQQKMYMTFGGTGKMVEDNMPKGVEFEETGRTQEIAGYKCSEFIITDGKETHEVWATDELGRYISFVDAQKSKGKTPAWAQLLMERELFPLHTIMKDRRGKVKSEMLANKVEPQNLSDEVFEIPAGYTKFEMPSLGGLLKGLGRE